MTAYESLNRVRNSKAEYERLLVKVEYLEALAEKATPIISGMPRASAKAGQSDDPWASLVDYKESCREQLTAYIKDCEALEKELNCIKSSRVRTAMKCRYIDLFTVSRIAALMSMNERSAYRLLQRGVKIYTSLFEKGELNG